MNDQLNDDRLSGAGAVLPSVARPDDRLDAALAFFLAFTVLAAVWLYAAKPWDVVSGDWLAKPASVVESVAVMPAAVDVADAAPESVRTVVDASVPVAPLPMLPAPLAPPAVAVLEAKPAPVVEAPSAPIVVAAPVVVEPVVVEPVVVASAPAPVVEPPKVATPTVVIRENIQFALNSAAIPEADKVRLDEVAKILAADPRQLKIAGHTDNSGKRGTNTVLSLKRAQSVRDYLVARGASADRLVAVGMGPDQPIADNKTEAGRAKNRRIDITE